METATTRFIDFDPTLKTLDKPGTWERIRSAFVTDLKPVGALEESLVERLALLTLRQRRVARFEHGVLSERVQRIHDQGWSKIQSYRSTSRYFRDAFKFLQSNPDDRELPLHFATAILRMCADHAEFDLAKSPVGFSEKDRSMTFLRAKNSSAKDLEDEESPAYAAIEWSGIRYDLYDNWSIEKLKAAVSMIAKAAGTTLENILSDMTDGYREKIAAEYAKTQADKMRESIPGDSLGVLPTNELDRIKDYEGHLREEYTATFKQLQAVQAKRTAPAAGAHPADFGAKRTPSFPVLLPREVKRVI